MVAIGLATEIGEWVPTTTPINSAKLLTI